MKSTYFLVYLYLVSIDAVLAPQKATSPEKQVSRYTLTNKKLKQNPGY